MCIVFQDEKSYFVLLEFLEGYDNVPLGQRSKFKEAVGNILPAEGRQLGIGRNVNLNTGDDAISNLRIKTLTYLARHMP